jgi:hypothetical protein
MYGKMRAGTYKMEKMGCGRIRMDIVQSDLSILKQLQKSSKKHNQGGQNNQILHECLFF